MKKYVITLEIEAEYIPSDVMDELVGICAVQIESLTDGSMEFTEESFEHKVLDTRWDIAHDDRVDSKA